MSGTLRFSQNLSRIIVFESQRSGKPVRRTHGGPGALSRWSLPQQPLRNYKPQKSSKIIKNRQKLSKIVKNRQKGTIVGESPVVVAGVGAAGIGGLPHLKSSLKQHTFELRLRNYYLPNIQYFYYYF